MEDIPVNIIPHNSLNFTRGVIKHLILKTCLKRHHCRTLLSRSHSLQTN